LIFQNKKSNAFKALFEGISESVLIVNQQLKVVEFNNATLNLFLYKPEELYNQSINLLIPSRFHSQHDDYAHNFMGNNENRQMGYDRSILGLKKNGKEFPLEAGLNPFKINGDTYVMVLITDITERKKKKDEIKELNHSLEKKVSQRTEDLKNTIIKLENVNKNLQQEVQKRQQAENRIKNALAKEKELNELKSKFLSLVSHEFKTPLSGILSSATLTGKYTTSDQQVKRDKHLQTIKNKVRYLTGILNDFLSLERLESGKVNYKFEKFSLKSLINEVIYNANITLKSNQELNYNQNYENIILIQDKGVLELALSNILGNAIKYSKEDASIVLQISTNASKVKFEIKDQGLGIPETDQKHIFDRYFRAENVANQQGTGIGLNITKTHIENLGGQISFTSQEGKGTTFYITIPITHE
jgi:hypothetical protein